MKSAAQTLCKTMLQISTENRNKVPSRKASLFFIKSVSAMVMTSMLAGRAQGQDSQFLFDPNGNLLVQAAAAAAPPLLLRQPQNLVVAPGDTATFYVVVADGRGVSYQWQFNGANIAGASTDTFLLQNAGGANEGQYRVVVTNPSGSITSTPAMLWLDSDGDGLPDSWELAYFGNLNQTATGDFDGDGVSNLQEFLDGTDPTDTNSVLYVLAILSDGGIVQAVPNKLSYTNGETVALTATAFAPGIFHGWTGDITTPTNVISLTMTNSKSLFAHFLPLDIIWTNSANGDWFVPTNWTPNLVPGPNDNVFVTNSVTVTLNSDAECLGLNLGNSIWSPTLAGTGSLMMHGASFWLSGSMSGSGRTLVDVGASLNLPGTTTVFLGGGRTLENAGTILWSGVGDLGVFGSSISNRSGALFDAEGSGSIYLTFGSPSRFDNAGTFRKTNSLATTTISASISFNNYGIVDVQSSGLLLAGGGVNAGTINVPAGTTLNLAGGTFTSTTDSTLTGAGNLTVSGATATLAGLVNVSGVNTFSNGTANLTGNYICTNNALVISGGVTGGANFNGTGTVAPAILTLTGGSLGGASTVTVGTMMNWSSATMTGTGVTRISPGVTLFITNASVTLTGNRTLDNAGSVLWTGSASIGVFSSVITNRPGALFDAQSTGSIYLTFGNPSRFDNAGIFRKSDTAATITVSTGITFNDYGTLEIPKGILAATGGFTCSSNALLKTSLEGTNAGTDYGQLQAGGAVTVQGALSVDLANGFLPVTNASFTVLTAGSRNGAFANFFYPSNLVTMQLSNTANSVLVRIAGVLGSPNPVLLQPMLAGSNILLSWTAVSNALYRVEFKPLLDATNWNALPGDVTASNSTATKLDSLTPSNRFYRVKVLP